LFVILLVISFVKSDFVEAMDEKEEMDLLKNGGPQIWNRFYLFYLFLIEAIILFSFWDNFFNKKLPFFIKLSPDVAGVPKVSEENNGHGLFLQIRGSEKKTKKVNVGSGQIKETLGQLNKRIDTIHTRVESQKSVQVEITQSLSASLKKCLFQIDDVLGEIDTLENEIGTSNIPKWIKERDRLLKKRKSLETFLGEFGSIQSRLAVIEKNQNTDIEDVETRNDKSNKISGRKRDVTTVIKIDKEHGKTKDDKKSKDKDELLSILGKYDSTKKTKRR